MIQPTATNGAREVGLVDGVRYLRRRTAGPSIIFVHGFCGSGDLFDVVFDSAALEDFDLIAVDLPGHGGSITPHGGEGQGSDLFFRGDHLKGVANLTQGKPLVWVGWSLGAIPIAEFLKEDSQVNSCGVNLIGPSFVAGNQKAIERAGEGFSRSLRSMLSLEKSERPETLLDFADVICGRDLPLFKLALVGGASLTSMAVRRASLSRDVDVEAFYRNLQLPLLVSIGARDSVIDVSPAMELVSSGSSTKSLSIYAEIGHSVFAEDCSRYSAELAEFVRSVTR